MSYLVKSSDDGLTYSYILLLYKSNYNFRLPLLRHQIEPLVHADFKHQTEFKLCIQ